MALREDILSKVFSAKTTQFKKRSYFIDETEVEIRQPSVEDKSKIAQETIKYETVNGVPTLKGISTLDTEIWTTLLCTYIKDTDQKLFIPEVHYEQLKKLPAGCFVTEIAQIANEISGEDTEKIKKQ